jgi:hypothetical protein
LFEVSSRSLSGDYNRRSQGRAADSKTQKAFQIQSFYHFWATVFSFCALLKYPLFLQQEVNFCIWVKYQVFAKNTWFFNKNHQPKTDIAEQKYLDSDEPNFGEIPNCKNACWN